jgi:hypothetical protein
MRIWVKDKTHTTHGFRLGPALELEKHSLKPTSLFNYIQEVPKVLKGGRKQLIRSNLGHRMVTRNTFSLFSSLNMSL